VVVAAAAFSWALAFLARSLRPAGVWWRGSLGVWRINLVRRGGVIAEVWENRKGMGEGGEDEGEAKRGGR
jgi:hypothetical protein